MLTQASLPDFDGLNDLMDDLYADVMAQVVRTLTKAREQGEIVNFNARWVPDSHWHTLHLDVLVAAAPEYIEVNFTLPDAG